MEFQCRVIVQRRCTSCCSSVENIPLQAERHSARRQKLFAFPPESAFTFRRECCSESQRNGVRLHNGIAFTFDRIPHKWEIKVGDSLLDKIEHGLRTNDFLIIVLSPDSVASQWAVSFLKSLRIDSHSPTVRLCSGIG